MKTKKLEKLISIRKKTGLSMYDMARILRICPSYYCQIELGKRNLYYAKAKEIAAVFGLKPDELFYDDVK